MRRSSEGWRGLWVLPAEPTAAGSCRFGPLLSLSSRIQVWGTPAASEQAASEQVRGFESAKRTDRYLTSSVSVVCMLSWWWCGHILFFRLEDLIYSQCIWNSKHSCVCLYWITEVFTVLKMKSFTFVLPSMLVGGSARLVSLVDYTD